MAVSAIDGNLLLADRSAQAAALGGPVLSLAAGLAVRAAIQQVDSQVIPDLKWPNDVLISGEKVSGILTEMNAEATRVRYIVVGVGINVNQASFPQELSATSLRLVTGREWSRVELVAAFG